MNERECESQKSYNIRDAVKMYPKNGNKVCLH